MITSSAFIEIADYKKFAKVPKQAFSLWKIWNIKETQKYVWKYSIKSGLWSISSLMGFTVFILVIMFKR